MKLKQQYLFIVSFVVLLSVILLLGLFRGTSQMPGKSYSAHFLPLSEREKEISSNLHKHVYKLAGEIGERNIWLPSKLNAAAAYIEGMITITPLKTHLKKLIITV